MARKKNKTKLQSNTTQAIRKSETLKRGKRHLILTFLLFWGKAIFGALLLAITLFIISYFFLTDKIELNPDYIEIKRKGRKTIR